MKNEDGKITITVGMLIGVIVLLLIIIVCLVVYNVNVNENKPKVSEQNSYTELVDSNKKEEKANTSQYSNLKDNTLNEKDVLFITEAKKNKDNTYTLNGVAYKHDDKNSNEAEISDRWILTNNYYSVTLSADLPCEMKYDYDKQYKNVNDIFTNYNNKKPENTPNPSYKNCFRFTFKNNECIGIENVLTGLDIEENVDTDEDVNKYITNKDVNTSQTTDYSKLKGEYTRVPVYETAPATLEIVEASEKSLKFKVSASSIRVNENESIQSALDRGAVNIGGYEGTATKISENQWKSTNTEDMEELGKYEVILTLNNDNTIQLETKYDEQYGNVYCGNGVTLEGVYKK